MGGHRHPHSLPRQGLAKACPHSDGHPGAAPPPQRPLAWGRARTDSSRGHFRNWQEETGGRAGTRVDGARGAWSLFLTQTPASTLGPGFYFLGDFRTLDVTEEPQEQGGPTLGLARGFFLWARDSNSGTHRYPGRAHHGSIAGGLGESMQLGCP